MSTPADQVNATKKSSSEQLEEMLRKFETENKDGSAKQLRALIESSPALKEKFETAIKNGELTGISLLSEKDKNEKKFAGGFDAPSGMLRVDIDQLKAAAKSDVGKNDLFFSLNHELSHASTRKAILDGANKTFDETLAIRADLSKKVHDYTAVVEKFVGAAREREATAEIEGYNALAERVTAKNPKATLKDLYEASPGHMSYFIDVDTNFDPPRYSMKKGIDFDENTLKIKMPSADNVKALGKYYFDENKEFDYRNYYAAPLIQVIAGNEKIAQDYLAARDKNYVPPETRIDLKRLGLDEGKIEKRISLPDDKPFPYVDGSDGKTEKHKLEPGLRMPPPATPSGPGKSGAMALLSPSDGDSSAKPERLAYGDNDHLYNPALGRMTETMKTLGPLLETHLARLGVNDPSQRENLTAAAASGAILGGLKRADSIAVSDDGKTVFVMDGRADHSNRIAIDIAKAIEQPLARSMAQVEQSQIDAPRPAGQVQSVEPPERGARHL